MHSKPLTKSMQVPPWGQGSDAHSSVSGKTNGSVSDLVGVRGGVA